MRVAKGIKSVWWVWYSNSRSTSRFFFCYKLPLLNKSKCIHIYPRINVGLHILIFVSIWHMILIIIFFSQVVILGLFRNLTSFHSWVCPYSPKLPILIFSQNKRRRNLLKQLKFINVFIMEQNIENKIYVLNKKY